jgi:hypothetical protein
MCKASAGGPPKEVLCKFQLQVSNMSSSELGDFTMSLDLKLLLGDSGRPMTGMIGFSTQPILSTDRITKQDSSMLIDALQGLDVGRLIGGCSLAECVNLFPYRIAFPAGYEQTGEVVEMFAFNFANEVAEGICLSELGSGLSASTNVKAGAFVAVALRQLGIDVCFKFPFFTTILAAATETAAERWDTQFGITLEATFLDANQPNIDELLALMSLATESEAERLRGLAPALTQVLRDSLLPRPLRMNLDATALGWHYSRSAAFFSDNLIKIGRTCEPLLCDLYTTQAILARSPPATGENKICRDDSRPDVTLWKQCTPTCAEELVSQLFPPEGLSKGCCFTRLNERLMSSGFLTNFPLVMQLCNRVNPQVVDPCILLNMKNYTAYPSFAPTEFDLNRSLTPLISPRPLGMRSSVTIELLCTPFTLTIVPVVRSAIAASLTVSTDRILVLQTELPTIDRTTGIVEVTVADNMEQFPFEPAAPTLLQKMTLQHHGGTLKLPCPIVSLKQEFVCAICSANETCQVNTGECVPAAAVVAAASKPAVHVSGLLGILVASLVSSRLLL